MINITTNITKAVQSVNKEDLVLLNQWLRFLADSWGEPHPFYARKMFSLFPDTSTHKVSVQGQALKLIREQHNFTGDRTIELCKEEMTILPTDQLPPRWQSTTRKILVAYAVSTLREIVVGSSWEFIWKKKFEPPFPVTPEMIELAKDRQWAILADCAADNGCTWDKPLAHLRIPAKHNPYCCWAVRAILGKNLEREALT